MAYQQLSVSVVLVPFSKPIRSIVNKAKGTHLIRAVNIFGLVMAQ